jgi:hypothetical protein
LKVEIFVQGFAEQDVSLAKNERRNLAVSNERTNVTNGAAKISRSFGHRKTASLIVLWV